MVATVTRHAGLVASLIQYLVTHHAGLVAICHAPFAEKFQPSTIQG
jgi:hypothetical protein